MNFSSLQVCLRPALRLVTWMTEALGLPSTLKEPGFLYDCPRSVSCFRGGRLTARQVRFGDLPFDVECVVDGSPHYLHSQHFPNFLRVVNDLRVRSQSKNSGGL